MRSYRQIGWGFLSSFRGLGGLCLVWLCVAGCGKSEPLELKPNDFATLRKAIKNDEPATFQTYLSKGLSPNAADENGVPYVVLAAKAGYNDIVRGLVNGGADVNTRDKDGRTLLHIAIDKRASDMAFDLLRWNANVNLKYPDGRTPVMAAVQSGSADLVRTILDKKPDLTPKDDRGETALSLAQKSNKPEILDLIQKAGAK
jgi:uncharacterized protein